MQNNARGFTLIELSIVVVIIGIIIGAIVTGQSLVHASALQSVVSDFEKYRSATIKFKDKYKQLPGDYSAATGVWGPNASCAIGLSSAVDLTTTCNGNGDTFIGVSVGGNPLVPVTNGEPYLFWQHLRNAEFIQGTYNGRAAEPTIGPQIGLNVPITQIENASFTMAYMPTDGGVAEIFPPFNYNHVFVFGVPPNFGNITIYPAYVPILTPEEGKIIDGKIDDGRPGMGKVRALILNNCTTSNAPTTAEYNVAATDLRCALAFISGF